MLKAALTGLGMLFLLAGTGCLKIVDNPAPGCVKYVGLAPVGGCFGKSIIRDVKVEPVINTLVIEANNCNGGVLSVRNLDSLPASLADVQIEPGDFAILDIQTKLSDGKYVLKKADNNFSGYIPAADETITIAGRLGNRDFTVTYIKTARLCK